MWCLFGGWEGYFCGYHVLHIYNNATTIALDVKASDIPIIEFSFEGSRVGKCRGVWEEVSRSFKRCREVLRGVMERGIGARQRLCFCRCE